MESNWGIGLADSSGGKKQQLNHLPLLQHLQLPQLALLRLEQFHLILRTHLLLTTRSTTSSPLLTTRPLFQSQLALAKRVDKKRSTSRRKSSKKSILSTSFVQLLHLVLFLLHLSLGTNLVGSRENSLLHLSRTTVMEEEKE